MTRVRIPAEAARGPRSELCRWSNKWAAKRRCHDDRWTMSYTPLSYLSFSFFRSVFLASYPVFPFLRSFLFLSRLSLLFFSIPARARVRILSSLGISYLFSFFLSLSPSPSSFVFHLPCNFPFADPLRIYPSLFIPPLFLSFFLSFFGRFSQLSLFSSLTPYTYEIRRDNSAVCLLSSQHKPHLSTCLRFVAFLSPLDSLSSSHIQAQFLSFSSTVFPRTYFPLFEGTV